MKNFGYKAECIALTISLGTLRYSNRAVKYFANILHQQLILLLYYYVKSISKLREIDKLNYQFTVLELFGIKHL